MSSVAPPSGDALPFWIAGLLFAGYTLVVVEAASRLVVRRDITTRSSAPTASRRRSTIASRWGRTSSSESVRSCAWNVSRSASERRPGPSASASRQTSKTWTSLSSSPPGAAHGCQHGARGVLVGHDDRDVLAQRRELRERQRPRGLPQPLAQPVEVELHDDDGIVEAVAPAPSAGAARRRSRAPARPAPARSPCARGAGTDRDRRRSRRRGRSRRPRRGSTRARPCRGRTRPARRRGARRRRRAGRASRR